MSDVGTDTGFCALCIAGGGGVDDRSSSSQVRVPFIVGSPSQGRQNAIW